MTKPADFTAMIRERETDGPMFPRGPHQMVAYCYAMAGAVAYERSVHARMIELMNAGDIEPFDPKSVNMSGLDAVQRVAECGQLVRQIEETVLRDHALLFRAKFLAPEIPCKQQAIDLLLPLVKAYLSRGQYRRSQRSNAYLSEILLQVVGPPKDRVYGDQGVIAGKYGVRDDFVSRDLSAIGKLFRGMQESAFVILRKKFDGKSIFCK